MKKKILAFFFALHIFCFSLVYCFCCPVYAVGEEVLLFEGFQSLMFMLGLSADLSSGMSQSQWVTKVDSDFSNAIAQKSQEQQDILYDNYAEFKDNLQHGYMIITDTLFDFFKDTAYDDVISPAIKVENVPVDFRSYIGTYAGYYAYFGNTCNYNETQTWDCLVAYGNNINGGTLPDFSYYDPPQINQTNTYTKRGLVIYVNPSHNIYCRTWKKMKGSSSITTEDSLASSYNAVEVYFKRPENTNGQTTTYKYLGYFSSVWSTSYSTLTGDITKSAYENIIDDTFVNSDGYITTTDGVLPQVLDDTTIGDLVDDVKTGQKSWASAIGSITDSYPENPAMPEDTMTLPELDQLIADLHLERLQSKFPFCIPHDIQLIYSGATAVSANAPVLVIPIDITFKEHTYFHDDEFITIDFSMFDSIIPIFREGFFLLFLVGLLWVSIHILQAFFVVTE